MVLPVGQYRYSSNRAADAGNASYQRGTNENTNGIIRRTWPKKMPLGHLTEDDLSTMEMLINTMPRKVLGGLTPLEVYTGQSIALIA